MDSNVAVALIGLVGTFFGSLLGIVGGQKLNEFRLKKLEEKQKEQEEHQGDTDTKVVNLQIAVTAVEKKVDAQGDEINDIKTEQKRLAEYHMKDKKE